MTITLDPEIAERVNEKIASGEFSSPDDFVTAALCYYLNNDLDDPLPPEQMKNELLRAETQFERDEYSTDDENTLREFAAQIKAEGRRKLAEKQQASG
jgi:Arc/MetJ-type ribon-helix-helix transcriptional regulator